MYKIIDKRGTGKTSHLMLLAQEQNGILVCANPSAMEVKADAYGLYGFNIISYYQYLNGDFDPSKPIFIDELDSFIKIANYGALAGYSISIED